MKHYYYLQVGEDVIMKGDEVLDKITDNWRPVNPFAIGMKVIPEWPKVRRSQGYFEINNGYIFNLIQG